jgi:ABC-type multidrug transport system fused ATPase/permease subunit
MTIPEHDRHRTGDLISRVGTDTTLLKTALAQSLANVFVGALTLLGAVVLMVAIDPVLFLVALLCVFAATAVVLLIASRVREATEEAQRRVGALSAALERVLRALRTVKISRAEDREENAISSEAWSAYRAGLRSARLEALVVPATSVVLQGSFVLVLGIGGARLASGDLALEELVAFLLYMLYLVSPLAVLFVSFTEIQQGLGAVGRLKEVRTYPIERYASGSVSVPSSDASTGGPAREAGPGKPVVSFEAVSFGYVPERPVLRDVSFEVPRSGLTALVGPSGAGKSTVFALLERFYEADSGRVLLDGVDVRELPLEEVRTKIGYVEQDSPVMAGSVRENILYASPEATEEELDAALDLANLRSFVERLPRGLDTEVGEGGVLLSGGERQRVAIARMLLVRPRLLLLDEVTSQLDAANERALRDAIVELSRRCAVVAIAHRLSTVQDAERIIVLDEGRVRGLGTHERLMKSDALYRELVSTQLIDVDGLVTEGVPGGDAG